MSCALKERLVVGQWRANPSRPSPNGSLAARPDRGSSSLSPCSRGPQKIASWGLCPTSLQKHKHRAGVGARYGRSCWRSPLFRNEDELKCSREGTHEHGATAHPSWS